MAKRQLATSGLVSMLAVPHPLLVEHALNRYTILTRWVSRAANNGIASMPLATHPQVWQTFFDLQKAAFTQWQQQQLDWMNSWDAWLEELSEIKRVNTLSKLVEQEFNLAAQLVILLQERTTELVKLQENVQVNYGYWVNEQLGPALEPPA